MKPPTSQNKVCQFIGVVKYHRNMWSILSHTLSLLTNITPSKVKFKCTKIEKYAFNETKRVLVRNTLLDYLYFDQEFKIYTNARNSS